MAFTSRYTTGPASRPDTLNKKLTKIFQGLEDGGGNGTMTYGFMNKKGKLFRVVKVTGMHMGIHMHIGELITDAGFADTGAPEDPKTGIDVFFAPAE